PRNPGTGRRVAPSYTRTRGAPPGPAAATTSATPSPVTSPAATRISPANEPNGRTENSRLSAGASNTLTVGSASPAPGPTTTTGAALGRTSIGSLVPVIDGWAVSV